MARPGHAACSPERLYDRSNAAYRHSLAEGHFRDADQAEEEAGRHGTRYAGQVHLHAGSQARQNQVEAETPNVFGMPGIDGRGDEDRAGGDGEGGEDAGS